MGHYAGQCPNKKNKQVATSTEVGEFSTKFEEFSLVVCLSTSATSSNVWYIDSGSSHHMTGVRCWCLQLREISFVPSKLAEDGQCDFVVSSVFSEDVTMWRTIVGVLWAGRRWAMWLRCSFYIQWGCNDEDRWFPLAWQRMGDVTSLFPLYSVRM